MINKIKKAFSNKENLLFLVISFFLAFNSVLFVYLAIKHVNFISFFGGKRIYVTYFLILLLYFSTLIYILRNPVNFFYIAKKTLLALLPTVAILDYGFYSHSVSLGKMPYGFFFNFFTSLYLFAVGFYFIFFSCKKHKNILEFFKVFQSSNQNYEETERKKLFQERHHLANKIPVLRTVLCWFFVQGFIASIVIISIVGLNIAFGSYHLSKFAAVDEPLWTYDRIPKFWNNVQDGEFFKTMISDKPGITVAIISGIGLNWTNPYQYKSVSWEGETNENYPDVKNMNFALRFPIFLFNALMLLVFYAVVKRLLGKATALFSLIFVGLSPILIGISSIINPDSLLWVFAPLSFLSYFVYVKEKSDKYLYLSGILLGFSILTKYVANILYVFFFLAIFLEYIINKKNWEDIAVSDYFKRKFSDYLVIVFFSLFIFFLFLPAAWVNILRLSEGTILSKAFLKIWPFFIGIMALVLLDMRLLKSRLMSFILIFFEKRKSYLIKITCSIFILFIFSTLAVTYSHMKLYDLESILASPKTSGTTIGFVGLVLANFYSLIFAINPVALIALVSIPFLMIFSKKDDENGQVYFFIILFILIYYIASSVENVSATIRYQIILYPMALIVAAAGINKFTETIIFKKYVSPSFSYVILIIISAYSLNFIRPFYFSYASDLLPRQYVLNLKDMGDGSYEAAQFLNSLPDAHNLIVWTDKRGVCAFFIGSCHSGFDFDKNKTLFDYFVVSSGRENRTSKMTLNRVNGGNTTLFRLDKLYDIQDTDFKLEIGNRPNNFVKVISKEDFKK